ncbi:TPA: hypothetical protein R4104_001515 [Enterobacter asburiae]|uniref:hypothetical protein n=1 Tax=Enterobacter asburiae TaxID=61645 RepID=UPI00265D935B|nr:hypothetical protein [Enterobacter asburiae]HCM9127842.1 hypothetical protein [Enterobacter asburiae]HED1589947.1 hypothetical protein [Enterobacter asburiae]HED2713896.1 hypothetical protein [Enterobacter asburiae]HED3276655.1 hypothetical protein [Enterobacter asburiae]
MDESRKAFERWWEVNFHNGNAPRHGWEFWRDGEGYSIEGDEEFQWRWEAWQASRDEITKGSIVAYQDHYGNAISAGDFDGGEDEMHETAFQEGWTPLVRVAGIKVKE